MRTRRYLNLMDVVSCPFTAWHSDACHTPEAGGQPLYVSPFRQAHECDTGILSDTAVGVCSLLQVCSVVWCGGERFRFSLALCFLRSYCFAWKRDKEGEDTTK